MEPAEIGEGSIHVDACRIKNKGSEALLAYNKHIMSK